MIDRLIRDESGTRWVVDYKTSRHEGADVEAPANITALLDAERVRQQQALLEGMATRNGRWFEIEMDKLERQRELGSQA